MDVVHLSDQSASEVKWNIRADEKSLTYSGSTKNAFVHHQLID